MKYFTEKRILIATAVLALLTVGIIIFSFLSNTPTEEVTTFSMGSYVQQTVYGQSCKEASAKAANDIARLEDKISWRKEGSDIQRLNEAAGGNAVEIEQVTAELLSTSLTVAKKSKGAFDPTIAPLSWLWNFDYSPTEPPSPEDIVRFKKFVDYNKLKVNGTSALIQSEGFAVDLGAVGKGAACDTAALAYNESDVSGAVVSVGGSVGCIGTKPGGGNWSVAVRNPYGDGALGSLSVKGGTFISTSGNYEKYFDYDGKRYHHLLSPATGYPADSGLISVTVVSDNGALSDALSTACFVMGYEKSLELLSELGAQAVFIDTQNKITVTEGIKDSFSLNSADFTL